MIASRRGRIRLPQHQRAAILIFRAIVFWHLILCEWKSTEPSPAGNRAADHEIDQGKLKIDPSHAAPPSLASPTVRCGVDQRTRCSGLPSSRGSYRRR